MNDRDKKIDTPLQIHVIPKPPARSTIPTVKGVIHSDLGTTAREFRSVYLRLEARHMTISMKGCASPDS